MSRLIELVNSKFTGVQKAGLDMKYSNVNVEYGPEYDFSLKSNGDYRYYQIRVDVNFGALGYVKTRNAQKNSDYEIVVYDIKRGLAEEVFGEFRPILMDMRRLIYEQDMTKLREKINELEAQMFSVEDKSQ